MDELQRALERAGRSLSQRAHSEQEIVDKLTRAEFDERIIAQAMAKLAAHGLIDDAAFAAGWALSRARRAMGPRRIVQELRDKGIDEETSEAVIAGLEEGLLDEQAQKLAYKQLARRDMRARQRAYAALQRRGYDHDMTRRAIDAALKTLAGTLPEEEDEAGLSEREVDALQTLALKHLRRGDPQARSRAYAAIRLRGYGHEDATAALETAGAIYEDERAQETDEEREAEAAQALEAATALAVKHLGRADKNARRRAYDAVRRRGYSHDVASQAIALAEAEIAAED